MAKRIAILSFMFYTRNIHNFEGHISIWFTNESYQQKSEITIPTLEKSTGNFCNVKKFRRFYTSEGFQQFIGGDNIILKLYNDYRGKMHFESKIVGKTTI